MMDKATLMLDAAPSWLVISHEKPDGDTLGCGVALARLGLRLSKRVRFICPDPCPPKYAFLTDGLNIEAAGGMPEDFPGADGVVICLDTSIASRSVPGLLDRSPACPLINIDHHGDNEMFGDVNWIDPSASATGEMVTALMDASPWGIMPDEAEALYAAIISDNGGFSFESTTLASHRHAMTLLEAGVSPQKVADELNSNLSAEILRLWGRAMSRATVFAGGSCALYWLADEDFAETGTTRDATENLVNFLMRIKGVKVAALCGEIPGCGQSRASIRARSPFSAREVANAFGGGGHLFASGCTINAPADEAAERLRDEMTRHVTRISASK
jgi:phosphoesterase RecJ-like protein